jgi:hypothetical protein
MKRCAAPAVTGRCVPGLPGADVAQTGDKKKYHMRKVFPF